MASEIFKFSVREKERETNDEMIQEVQWMMERTVWLLSRSAQERMCVTKIVDNKRETWSSVRRSSLRLEDYSLRPFFMALRSIASWR